MSTTRNRTKARRPRTVEDLLATMPTHVIDLRGDVFRLMRTTSLINEVTIPQAPHTGDLPPKTRALFDYAILSHRWGPQEPDFKTVMNNGLSSHGKLDAGTSKLMRFCQTAKTRKIPFAWSDTCCINKESSAELQEAINSMFSWYSNAKLCIVYLAETIHVEDLGKDPWVTRGWTLQELLAPQFAKFYNRDWTPLVKGDNDKLDTGFLSVLSSATGISQESIQRFEPGVQDVREKMIWASKRRTTRVEDVAYSLLGIFKVTMPIIYGEKEQAFFRLQEEIMKKSSKKGLFDWTGEPSDDSTMLAFEPACFRPPAEQPQPRYSPWQISKFYTTTMLYLFTYDLWVVIQDYILSFAGGEIANIGKIGHSLTSRGIRAKFQLYNVAQITLVSKESEDGYYEYKIKANSLKTIRIKTAIQLEPDSAIARAARKAVRAVIPTGLGIYRIAMLNGWTIGGFTGWHTKKCIAVLLRKINYYDAYHFERIPTQEPMLVMRNRNKWLVPETVYVQ